MDFGFSLDIYDDIFSFDNAFKGLLADGRFEDVLVILQEFLKNEKKGHDKMRSFIENLLDSDLEIDEMECIERTYNLLDVCTTRIRMLEEFIEKIESYVRLSREF